MPTKHLLYRVKRRFDKGMMLPKNRVAFQTSAIGRLEIRRDIERSRNKQTLIANLRPAAGGGENMLPPMYDVVIELQTSNQLILSGVEIEEDGLPPRHHAQAWECEIEEIQLVPDFGEPG